MSIDLYNGDCLEILPALNNIGVKADVVLTSPPYNTNKKAGDSRTIKTAITKGYSYVRYDQHCDNMSDDEYSEFTVKVFNHYNNVLKDSGVVLYNLSYGNENTNGMFLAVADIIRKTNFTLADCIVWKKKSALPNNMSRTKLTRITEFVFVFCKKGMEKSFYTNKKVVSNRDNGQCMFNNVFNFIEAKNNDAPCPLNKATYSTELCDKLLSIYAPSQGLVVDSFCGSGTTAVSCKRMGLNFIGIEISKEQCAFAKKRIDEAVEGT